MSMISIIVPVFNTEKYVGRCIESILNQSFSNFELILVDDYSVDRSRNICESYAEKDKRIKLICLEENGGVSNARNVGIDYATGTYIMFADSDDYVDENWCQILYETVQKYPKALISSNICRVDNVGDVVPQVPNKIADEILTGYFALFKMGLSGFLINKIFQLQILNKHNIRFVKGQYGGEDVEFVVKYIKYCHSYVYIATPLYYYFINPLSAVHTYHEDDLLQNLRVFTVRLPLIEQEYLSEFCDEYFSFFMNLFENVFNSKCSKTFLGKMKYNQRAMNSYGFKFCVENMSGRKESLLFVRVVKTHNYYLLWGFQKISAIKQLFNNKWK